MKLNKGRDKENILKVGSMAKAPFYFLFDDFLSSIETFKYIDEFYKRKLEMVKNQNQRISAGKN